MEFAASIITLLILLALFALMIAGFWMVFVKAGEKGWKALIPFYNLYILFKISGLSGWWFGVLFIPLVIVVVGTLTVAIPEDVLVNQEALPFGITLLFNLFFASIQVISIVFSVMTYKIAQSFQKGLPFTLGLSLLGFIFWPILGLGDEEYVGSYEKTDSNTGSKDANESHPTPHESSDEKSSKNESNTDDEKEDNSAKSEKKQRR